jgi:hypothetical protein
MVILRIFSGSQYLIDIFMRSFSRHSQIPTNRKRVWMQGREDFWNSISSGMESAREEK